MADVFVRLEDNPAVLSEPVEEGLQGMGSIRSGRTGPHRSRLCARLAKAAGCSRMCVATASSTPPAVRPGLLLCPDSVSSDIPFPFGFPSRSTPERIAAHVRNSHPGSSAFILACSNPSQGARTGPGTDHFERCDRRLASCSQSRRRQWKGTVPDISEANSRCPAAPQRRDYGGLLKEMNASAAEKTP